MIEREAFDNLTTPAADSLVTAQAVPASAAAVGVALERLCTRLDKRITSIDAVSYMLYCAAVYIIVTNGAAATPLSYSLLRLQGDE